MRRYWETISIKKHSWGIVLWFTIFIAKHPLQAESKSSSKHTTTRIKCTINYQNKNTVTKKWGKPFWRDTWDIPHHTLCAIPTVNVLTKTFSSSKNHWRVKLQEHYDETTLRQNTQLERIIHNHLLKFWLKKEVQRIRHNLIKWTQINFKSIKASNQNPQWRPPQFLW